MQYEDSTEAHNGRVNAIVRDPSDPASPFPNATEIECDAIDPDTGLVASVHLFFTPQQLAQLLTSASGALAAALTL